MIAYDCLDYATKPAYREHYCTKHHGKLLALELVVMTVALILILLGGISQAANARVITAALGLKLIMAGGITLALLLILESSVAAYHYHRLASQLEQLANGLGNGGGGGGG